MAAPLDLDVLPGILSHFMVSSQGDTFYFTHRATGDVVAVPERAAQQLYQTSSRTPVEVFEALLARIMCGQCGIRLLAGEERICVPCEATQVMDLARIGAGLHRS